MPFQCLNVLRQREIKFVYTSFTQGAMVDILNDKWNGSCDALAHDWLYRKTASNDLHDVVTYTVTNPHLPHIVVTIDHDPEGPGMQKVKNLLALAYGEKHAFGQRQIDKQFGDKKAFGEVTRDESIDNLFKVIGSNMYCSGLLASLITIHPNQKQKAESGHALAFVKRGDVISFYDPNNGEITFDHFADFCTWFRLEATSGALKYIFADPAIPLKQQQTLTALHAQSAEIAFSNPHQLPSKTDNKAEKKFRKEILKIRDKKASHKNKVKNDYLIEPYRLVYWSGQTFTNPAKFEPYYDTNCSAVLVRVEPTSDDGLVKKLFKTDIQKIFFLVDKNLYVATKNEKAEIIIKKLYEKTKGVFAEAEHLLNPYNVKLKDNEQFKVINQAPVRASVQLFIEENMVDQKSKKVERKPSNDSIYGEKKHLTLFSPSDAQHQTVLTDDVYFQKIDGFLQDIAQLSAKSNNNTPMLILGAIQKIVTNCEISFQSKEMTLDQLRQVCHQEIMRVLNEYEDKASLVLYQEIANTTLHTDFKL